MITKQLTIEGMSCHHCVMAVQKELNKIPGIRIEDVKIGNARVEYDEHQVGFETFKRAVEQAGYKLASID